MPKVSLPAVIMGGGGHAYGPAFLRGTADADGAAVLADPANDGDDALPDADMLGYSKGHFDHLPAVGQWFLREALENTMP